MTREIGLREARNEIGDIAMRANIGGEITTLTRSGKPVAIVAPAVWAELPERLKTLADEIAERIDSDNDDDRIMLAESASDGLDRILRQVFGHDHRS